MKRVRAGLEQPEPPVTEEETEAYVREARRLAELAGEFCLFGLDIALDVSQFEPADQAYRSDEEPEQAPANDAAPAPSFVFPTLTRRGVHLPAALPVRAMIALDWLVIFVVAELAALWGAGAGLATLSLGAAAAIFAAAASLKLGLWLTDTYRVTPARMRAERSVGGLAIGVIAGLVTAAAFAPDARSAAALSATLPFAAMLLAGVHAAIAVWTRAAHRAGVFSETIVLVGATDAAERVAARVTKSGEARVVAIVDDRLLRAPYVVGAVPVGGNVDDLLAWEGLPHVDRIVITVTQKAETRVKDIIQRLRVIPNRVDLLLDVDTFNVRGRGADRFAGAALACVSGRPHNHMRALLKRTQDLVLASLLLVAFALPMLVISLAVKLDSRGPVVYRQRRHGFNNRVITLLKFRSMRHEPDAPLRQVCANDPRITRLGRFLRRTSLDELPQLFNVLKGDMSLVGPRPHAIGMKAAERELEDIMAEYAHRHRVKPGITGWAQVNGSRGPLETPADVRRRVRYDLEYVARASLWLDLQILLRSAPILFGDAKATR
ncbi:MAG TPA: exopolysaccharide biosynthesis polyprenyl glycosylphosphotransferase [Vitreimonas sp.]|nr:exopolysaccharide biosynthesis polyprenyl glycosylphosphotransferase [Vitreimonas sp.]